MDADTEITAKFRLAELLNDAQFEFDEDYPHDPRYVARREPLIETIDWLINTFGSPAYHFGHQPAVNLNGYHYWMSGEYIVMRKRRFYDTAYDVIAPKYDEQYSSPMDKEHNDEFIAQIEPLRVGPILDIGCGTGFLLDYLDIPISQYRGIDNSVSMLMEFAAKKPDYRRRMLLCSYQDYYPVSERFSLVTSPFAIGEAMGLTDVKKLEKLLVPGGYWAIMAHVEEMEKLTRIEKNWKISIERNSDALEVLDHYSDRTYDIPPYRMYIGRRDG